MPHIYGVQSKASGGGEGGEPTGPAGGSLAGTYPNPSIAANAVKAEQIETGAVTAAKIATDAVIAAKIKAEAVETAKIKLLAITNGLLGLEAVTQEKVKKESLEGDRLAKETIGAETLQTNAITTIKITDANVTEAKLASEAVTAAKIKTDAVESAKIKAKAVTKEKLSTEVQEIIEPKVFERGFAIAGEVKAETYPGFFVKLGTGEEKKLIGVEGVLLEGTSVKVEVLKNGSGIAGYKSTEVEFTKTAAAVSSSKALTDKDLITIKPSGGVGTPKGLTCTLFLESVK